jgi:hypothetical protein
MEFYSKSALFQKICVAGFLLVLTSCGMVDDNDLPHVFSGNEVPPEVLAEPRVVTTPSKPVDTTWQRLGDMPFKPKNFTPQPTVDAAKRELENNRAAADKEGQDYENQ